VPKVYAASAAFVFVYQRLTKVNSIAASGPSRVVFGKGVPKWVYRPSMY